MAGNGHFQTQTPDGPVPCRIKPNTTGMDYLLARIMDIWNAMYDPLMIPPKDRHNLILNCMRYTPTVWENLATAQAAGGRLIAIPPPDANFQAMSLSEIRDSLKSLIQYGPPRNEAIAQTVSFNSQEVNTTRVASTKRKLCNNNIVCMASNVGSKNAEQREEGWTLDVVSAVMSSGVPPPAAKRRRIAFNDTEVNANTARNQPLENPTRDTAVNCIAYTATWAGTYVGLLNHIGAYQTEINKVVRALYDWGCYFIKQFVASCLDGFVRDNFSRMQEGYKSRGVIMSIWMKSMHTLSLGKSREGAIQHIWSDIHADALPLVMVPYVFCNLLYRGVHMGSLIMSNVIATHLHCPVVTLNISCYISGDATAEHLPVNPKTSLLRVLPGKDKDDNHDISHKVALRIAAQYGEELFSQCHMGPELSTYRLALVYLAERFAPDFRGLISANMFCSKQHLAALGLGQQASGMMDYVESAHPPFAKQFNIRGREQLQSQAIGVNIWSLLTVTSLIGSKDIHPDISNCFSNSLVEAILSHAPPASTPGNICPTPRFDHSGTANRLFVRDSPDRPKHFLRPNEPSFVLNGVLPIAKAVGRFAPEDMLHASQLSGVNLHCDIMEIPANAFAVSQLFFPFFCLLGVSARDMSLADPVRAGTKRLVHVPRPASRRGPLRYRARRVRGGAGHGRGVPGRQALGCLHPGFR